MSMSGCMVPIRRMKSGRALGFAQKLLDATDDQCNVSSILVSGDYLIIDFIHTFPDLRRIKYNN